MRHVPFCMTYFCIFSASRSLFLGCAPHGWQNKLEYPLLPLNKPISCFFNMLNTSAVVYNTNPGVDVRLI